MNWYRLDISAPKVLDGTLDDALTHLKEALIVVGEPKGGAVLTHADGSGAVQIFLTPIAAGLLSKRVSDMGGVNCDRPSTALEFRHGDANWETA